MARTFVRQETQIRNSDDYDDSLSAGSTLESGASNVQFDLNALRSQTKRAIHADSAGNWYDDVPTVNGKKRAIAALNTALDALEEKKILRRSQKHTPDITVPAGQNWVVLNAAGEETPAETAAVGAGTAEGAVVASLAGEVGSHSLNVVSGSNNLSPKNLVVVIDASTGQAIQSGDQDVFGLLQAESGTADGHAFNDTNHQAQISFVISNAGRTALIACPVADIENKAINYSYIRRVKLSNLTEEAFLTGAFLDTSATAEITLDRAIDSQSGAATQSQNVDWRVSDAVTLDFQDPSGVRNLLRIAPTGSGDTLSFDVDDFVVNNVNRALFLNGARFDASGTTIDIGDSVGTISSAGLLALTSGGTANVQITAAGEIIFDDGNRASSSYGVPLKLSDAASEWTEFEDRYGEVSLLSAIYQAGTSMRTKIVAVVTTGAAADTNMTGAGGTPNLSAQLHDFSTKDFVNEVDIYYNGQLLRNGANSAANHDVYPGTTPADGDLKFEFATRTGDVITVVA